MKNWREDDRGDGGGVFMSEERDETGLVRARWLVVTSSKCSAT